MSDERDIDHIAQAIQQRVGGGVLVTNYVVAATMQESTFDGNSFLTIIPLGDNQLPQISLGLLAGATAEMNDFIQFCLAMRNSEVEEDD